MFIFTKFIRPDTCYTLRLTQTNLEFLRLTLNNQTFFILLKKLKLVGFLSKYLGILLLNFL